MRIGLISDTHIEDPEEDLPDRVYDIFHSVDFILHAGDIYVTQVLDRLERIAPLAAVEGNGEWDRGVKDSRLADARVLTLEGLRVGLRHAIVYPERPPEWTLESEMRRCFGGTVNVIVVGDTHVALIEECRGVLIVNPGSPTWPNNYKKQPGTVGILEIVNARASASIIQL